MWVPTQNSEASLAALSEESGLPLDKCEVFRHDLGGGFGRRGGTQDYVHQAVAIAKEFPGIPVKLIWSREEDQAHDFYRPISQCKLSAGLDADGKLTGLHVRVSGQSINATLNPKGIAGGKDMRQLQGYYAEPGDAQLGYAVPNLLIVVCALGSLDMLWNLDMSHDLRTIGVVLVGWIVVLRPFVSAFSIAPCVSACSPAVATVRD